MTRASTLFVNAAQVVTCAGSGEARAGRAMSDAGVRTGLAVLVSDGRIVSVDDERSLLVANRDAHVIDCAGGLLTPGFVDSHTHAIFGRARYEEQEMRAAGVPYMEIARRGGGIHASVRDLRTRSEDELLGLARQRLLSLAVHGVTTVEVKSGYGLSLDDELKTLRVIRTLQETMPLRIVATFLGAHEIPLEFRERPRGRREYLDLVIREMLPAIAAERLASFADVFCEPGVFTAEESREILVAARESGLGIKLHADELKAGGGAELAAELRATSADHLAAVERRRHPGARARGHGGHAVAGHDVLPGQDGARSRASVHRCRVRCCAGHRLQSGHVANHQLPAHPDTGGEPVEAVGGRGHGCRHGERRRGAGAGG